MTVEKEVMVWNVENVLKEKGKIYAKDYYCIKCYKENKKIPADSFYGLDDPDAVRPPYCNNCIKSLNKEYWIYIMQNPSDW
ncbi:MAG: hypothetical protein NUV46_02730 [Nanoarchaeota archaeon]|nr:hypothetical protein [Nanoarchaeota archaeon]